MAVLVIKPGILTTVQDEGRWGYQSQGVPVAGPMDPFSHRLANALVGNPRDAAVLEITLVGPELEFQSERVIAICGAEFTVTMDDRPIKSNVAVLAGAGTRLKFGARVRGARAYLAIAGGIDVPPVLGSRSTHVISAMGGMGGRALRAGDQVPVGNARTPQRTASPLSDPVSALPDGDATVRVLPGPQADRFAPDALDVLQSAPYLIAQNSDRMGFRLEGPRLVHSGSADIISDATPLGVLQVPAAGQPILLMADRQTTGGYPKLATVIAADLAVAAQLAPGDRLSFRVCTPGVAVSALIAQERLLLAMESA